MTGEPDNYVTLELAIFWAGDDGDAEDFLARAAVRGVLVPEDELDRLRVENERLQAALQRIRDRECGVIPAWQIARDALAASNQTTETRE
jgi:ABC-type oligopeptide transport system substrate-binding subunit